MGTLDKMPHFVSSSRPSPLKFKGLGPSQGPNIRQNDAPALIGLTITSLTGPIKSRTVGKTHELNEADPVPYTLGQAAKATGKQKSTILEAVRNGRISAAKDDLGRYQIDPAELHRVYPPTVQTEREETHTNPYKTKLLEEKIKYLEREIARLERQEADLREDRDHWRKQATALLTDQRAKPEPSRKGLWEKLFRGG